jgi:hypothetical protein
MSAGPHLGITRILTFIVGASIVVSLIGRGEVANRVSKVPSTVDRLVAFKESAQETLAQEEGAIRAQKVKEDEEGAEQSSDKE